MDGSTNNPAAGKPARPRGRPKVSSDEDKRAQIVDAARKIFVEHGYAGTTTALVARVCNVSKQTLYKLFTSKEDLFTAVVVAHRKMMLDLPRAEEENLSVSDALQSIFMIDINEAEDDERATFIQLVMRESGQFLELREVLHNEGMIKSRQMLAEWLSSQQERGKLSIDDADSGARMLMDMIFGGMGPPEGRSQAWPDRQARRHHLQRCLSIFARGVGAK
ncbi:TetR family transcriptional regulator [Rhizobium sp. Root708]|uniref:TetR/AcrR family transcriptional regulator n=1 Tax=Rhizobium sp. Root708 TaxID=1736592 RepID=UPI0006F237B4|nr:TetR/AcrR family transcriptional regulator [Rhizobium sp. Root708]KRB61225.1 TetR family transcriptional regulator [Rhizobium sp. Root708]